MFDIEREIRLRHRPYERLDAEAATAKQSLVDDEAIIERILHSFLTRDHTVDNDPSSHWKTLLHNGNLELLAAFEAGSRHECALALQDPGSNYLTYGMDNVNVPGTIGFSQCPEAITGYASLCQDNILRLAEALGALWIDMANHPAWLSFAATRTNDVLKNIDEKIGAKLDFPNPFSQEVGLKTDRGVCSYRSISAIYLAVRARNLVAHVKKPKILEIGPGIGRSAYYAHKLGLDDYTIVDLPFPAGVMQGYFLMRTLGQDHVTLRGETSRPGSVKIIDPATFFNDSQHYDLIVNMDSITEFGHPVAVKYWDKISRSCSQFLSINHEVNGFRVYDLAKSPKVASHTRHSDWFRHGYLEEVIGFHC